MQVSGARGSDTSTPPAYVSNPGAFSFAVTDGTAVVNGQERRNTDPTGGANAQLQSLSSFDGTQVTITGTIASLTVSDSEGGSGGHSQAFGIGLCTTGWLNQAAGTYNSRLFGSQAAPASDGFAGLAFGSRNGSLYVVAYDYDGQPNEIFLDLGNAGLASGSTLNKPLSFALAFASGKLTVTLNGQALGSIPTSHDFSKALLLAMGVSADAANGNGSLVYADISAGGRPGLPMITAVVNGASFLPGIAPGSWATIVGTNLAATTQTAGPSDSVAGSLPTALGGTTVTMNGLPAFVYYVSPNQINVLVPDDPTIGTIPVQVITAAGSGSVFETIKSTLAPSLFLFTSTYPAAVHADGSYVGPPSLIAGVTTTPAKPNETISLFGTGFGPTNPATPAGRIAVNDAPVALPVSATIGGMSATVQGWMIYPGEYQFNVTVPNLPDGDAALVLDVLDNGTPTGLLLNIAH